MGESKSIPFLLYSMKRQIITINEEKCNGCGLCIPDCPEGALKIIDNKARLISDLFCDGLGACMGTCPQGAITTITREAEPYDEVKTMHENIVKKGPNTIRAHLDHLLNHKETELYNQAVNYLVENNIPIPKKDDGCGCEKPADCGCGNTQAHEEHHGHHHHEEKADGCGCGNMDTPKHHHEEKAEGCGCGNMELKFEHQIEEKAEIPPLACGCPGSLSQMLTPKEDPKSAGKVISDKSELRNWPVQLNLAPVKAQYFDNAHVLIAADCVPASYPLFHQDFVKGKTLLIGCPKLDDAQHYIEKLGEIFKQNNILSLEVLIMEVPCCRGMMRIIEMALDIAGKKDTLPVTAKMIMINGTARDL